MTKKIKSMAAVGIVLILGISYCILSPNLKQILKPSSDQAPKKFGATYMTMNNPFFIALNDSIEETVEANGDILLARDPAQDQDKQNEQILDLIEEGVVGIFLNPVDSKRVKPALEACREAGIPVFNIDAAVEDTDLVESVILSDNYDAGVQCANYVMSTYSSARVAVLESPLANSAVQRIQGFIDTLSTSGGSNYEIVHTGASEGELEIAMATMDQIIKEGIEFDVVFGENDPAALGSFAALQANNKDEDIAIFGIDGSPDVKIMLAKGFITGSVAQSPIQMGSIAAGYAYDYLKGKEIPKEHLVPVTLITKRNLKDFPLNEWQ